MGEGLHVLRESKHQYFLSSYLSGKFPIALAVRGVWLNASETRKGEAGRRAFVMSQGRRITKFP